MSSCLALNLHFKRHLLKNKIKKLLFLLSAVLVLLIVYVCWISFPIATGYGAKVLCSGVFVSGRNEQAIIAEDLDFFPVNCAKCKIDFKDSSATCSLLGLATHKAIYRKGLGATLINDLSEQEIRAQHFSLPAKPVVNTDTVMWPMGDKTPGTLPAIIDSLKLMQAVNAMFSDSGANGAIHTRAIIVLYNGQIVAEKYADGLTQKTPLIGWSMTKSITGALTGIAGIDVNSPAPVDAWKNDDRQAITIKNLLQQSSGLKFEEVYNRSSNANRMLFRQGDAGAYAAGLPLKHPPGSEFHYSSGNSNILSGILRKWIGDDSYYAFPYEKLFYRTGMYSAVLEPDAGGTFVGSSFCYATARDWARFGLLYANDGVFNGEQVLPAGWVQQSVVPAAAAKQGEYGYQWWLNAGAKDDPRNRQYPTLPTDMYYADGYEGQNIFVIPSKKLVVVRLGLTRKSSWGESEFLLNVMSAVR
jgi:CubicO group peptidase (beta-lactamase class C family)